MIWTHVLTDTLQSFKAYECSEKEKKPWNSLLLQMRELSIGKSRQSSVENESI